MAGTSWRLSLTFSPVAVLPTAALALLTLPMDGLHLDGFWGWATALLVVYLGNAVLDSVGTRTGYSGWLSGRTGGWIKLRWLSTGVLVNVVLLVVLPRVHGLLGLDTSTGGVGTVLTAGTVLGLCFFLGSRFEDATFSFEKGAPDDGADDPPDGVRAGD
ncbi:hypothetical protein [Plantactinospora endophytica]|uniref:Transmembrane protein n=1 Tax=Plantactinospora endophytica TaxID=673535 RepID=A0ABQ4DSI7_9ACTN|nr:hypothetical protein [Plantactinospora endophytica]GIG85422.1 hypothetical protein Pen02_03580 [Plantactinospora endophytica]